MVLWGDLCLEPLAPRGAALSCHGSSRASPMTVLPLPINDGAHIPRTLPLPHSTQGRQRSAGFCVGSLLSWQVVEFLLASQQGGEGMWYAHGSFISCSEVLAALWAGATECLSSEWLGSLQRYRDGWRLEKEQQECVM